MLQKDRMFVSTITPDAALLARRYGVGLEIAEYCTASHMDLAFAETHAALQNKLEGVPRRVLHAPFNELFPCAIDPKARELAAFRYRQAIDLAKSYGAEKIVIHSGYAPNFYYDCWFEEQGILFWKAFLRDCRETLPICLENVLETQPEPLLHILEAVNDPRLRICFDVGHAHTYSRQPVEVWLEQFAPWIAHFHLHNNHRDWDSHNPLADGTLDMKELLCRAAALCPHATFTLESTDAAPDFLWLEEQGLLR